MKKLYSVFCSKYRKFEKLKMSYLLEKTSVLSIICSKYKKEESVEILKILGIINNIEKYPNIVIPKKDIKQEFRPKK